jgi:hypothetical protein
MEEQRQFPEVLILSLSSFDGLRMEGRGLRRASCGGLALRQAQGEAAFSVRRRI